MGRARRAIIATTTAVGASKTLIQIQAATNHAVSITRYKLSFDGEENLAAPILVELLRQTTAGTGGSAGTVNRTDETESTTIDATSLQGFSAEPTAGAILDSFYVHPQGGAEVVEVDPDRVRVEAGNRIGLRVTQDSGETSVNVTGFLEFEE